MSNLSLTYKNRLSEEIANLEQKLADLQSDYIARKSALDDELRGILMRTKDALDRLKDIEARENQIKTDISTMQIELDKKIAKASKKTSYMTL